MSKVLILSNWPELKNAETEVISRIQFACKNVGAEAHIIDKNGVAVSNDVKKNLLPFTSKKPVDFSQYLFVISVHFQDPNVFPISNYLTIWNPLQYFVPFRYDASRLSFGTFDGFLSAEAEPCDNWARIIYEELNGISAEFPTHMYHIPNQPYKKPNVTSDSKLMYVGINWEAITGAPQRWSKLLKKLEGMNLISIYGPDRFSGKRPWEDYQSYVGEIPFDGISLGNELHKNGIGLAVTSDEHVRDGVLSNRFWETICAGAAVIANRHPLIEKYFSDCAYVTKGAYQYEVDDNEVINFVKDIRDDPKIANEKVEKAQKMFLENFSLEGSISNLIAYENKKSRRRGEPTNSAKIDIVHAFFKDCESGLEYLSEFKAKHKSNVNVHILISETCSNSFHAKAQKYAKEFSSLLRMEGKSEEFRRNWVDKELMNWLKNAASLKAKYVVFCNGSERIYDRAIDLLARGEIQHEVCVFDLIGIGYESQILDEEPEPSIRRLISAKTLNLSLGPAYLRVFCNIAFRNDFIFEENSRIWKAAPFLNEYALRESENDRIELQTCLFAGAEFTYGDSLAFIQCSDLVTPYAQMEVVGNLAIGGVKHLPVKTSNIAPVKLGSKLDFAKGSKALNILGPGFSTPEDTATWIDGGRAILRIPLECLPFTPLIYG